MSIHLEKLVKRFDGHPVVNHVSLDVKDGEFFVLLGSSGSGKTTILNLIAGLIEPTSGQIFLHGRDVTGLPTQERQVGFVFQNYALFQYMTVADNIEFALSIRKAPKTERQHRRDELLDLVGLGGLDQRMPSQLSGGQQQRVALARALAHKPDVLLLDEPLGALDAKIRSELRRSLRAIQRQLGIATILVTHDQEEAFDLADRIGVMSYGLLLEVGTPEELYRRPQTEFVATFLGSANLLVGQADNGAVRIGPAQFQAEPTPSLAKLQGQRVQMLFRPEEVALAPSPEALDCPSLGVADVEDVAFSGAYERLRLRLPPMPGVRAIAPAVPYGRQGILVDATRPPDQSVSYPLARGEKTYLGVRRIHTIQHPGLNFLVLNDGSLRSQYALDLAGQIGRMAHARVTLLNYATGQPQAPAAEARKALGASLGSLQEIDAGQALLPTARSLLEKQSFDLVIMGFRLQEDRELAESLLQMGNHHLLLIPTPQGVPTQALIAVTAGEPGKTDIRFAGRLAYHLKIEALLLTVLPGHTPDPFLQNRAEAFLKSGVRTLAAFGVAARHSVAQGAASDEIKKAVCASESDLLVMGVPLVGQGRDLSLTGVVGEVLKEIHDRAILLVRSQIV